MTNPLAKHFRKPEIYITLPSKGRWYPAESIALSDTGEIPIYPMTAKDDLMLRTPDALLNGESVIKLIESCAPAIKNAWHVPSLDIDSLLIAIRIASHGEKLDIDAKCPVCQDAEEHTYTIDCRTLLDAASNHTYQDRVDLNNGLVFNLRPLSYQELSKTQAKTWQIERVAYLLDNSDLDDEEKKKQFHTHIATITEITFNMMLSSIVSIEADGEIVSNREYIAEFINNADGNIFDSISNFLKSQQEQNKVKPQQVQCPTCSHKWEVPIEFDYSSFFAKGS